ncbi:MAG: hypothetical protein ACI8TP_000400 [Acidimicrobiales bacterium]
MELIEQGDVVGEAGVRIGPSERTRRLAGSGFLVLALVLVAWLFRPSTQTTPVSDRPSPEPTEASSAEQAAGASTSSTTAGQPFAEQTLVLPDTLPLPPEIDSVTLERSLVLVGQNSVGQVVAVDLRDRSVTELDPVNGQRFVSSGASNGSVAGFRLFVGETITITPDGVVRSMPVNQMDLPIVLPAADGDGFVIHETASNVLWTMGDDGANRTSPVVLPESVDLVAAVDGGVVLRTLDGVERRFDPVTGQFGTPLIGRIIAIGRDRYVALDCGDGSCVVRARALTDDAILSEPDIALPRPADRLSISPSGRRLALAAGGRLLLVDLDLGTKIASLDERGNAQFVWAPNDTVVYWLSAGEADGGPQSVFFHDTEGTTQKIEIEPSVIDVTFPLHAFVPAD